MTAVKTMIKTMGLMLLKIVRTGIRAAMMASTKKRSRNAVAATELARKIATIKTMTMRSFARGSIACTKDFVG